MLPVIYSSIAIFVRFTYEGLCRCRSHLWYACTHPNTRSGVMDYVLSRVINSACMTELTNLRALAKHLAFVYTVCVGHRIRQRTLTDEHNTRMCSAAAAAVPDDTSVCRSGTGVCGITIAASHVQCAQQLHNASADGGGCRCDSTEPSVKCHVWWRLLRAHRAPIRMLACVAQMLNANAGGYMRNLSGELQIRFVIVGLVIVPCAASGTTTKLSTSVGANYILLPASVFRKNNKNWCKQTLENSIRTISRLAFGNPTFWSISDDNCEYSCCLVRYSKHSIKLTLGVVRCERNGTSF